MQERIKETEQTWNQLEEIIKEQRLPERAMSALYLATVGFRVRNAMYRADAEVSDLVATKDLAMLVDRGLLEPRGERRGRFYVAARPLVDIREALDTRRATIEDPFASTD